MTSGTAEFPISELPFSQNWLIPILLLQSRKSITVVEADQGVPEPVDLQDLAEITRSWELYPIQTDRGEFLVV